MEGRALGENLSPSDQQALGAMLHGVSGVNIYALPTKDNPVSGKIINKDQVAIIEILEKSPKR